MGEVEWGIFKCEYLVYSSILSFALFILLALELVSYVYRYYLGNSHTYTFIGFIY